MLDQDVGGEGGGMDDHPDLRWCYVEPIPDGLQALEHGRAGIVRGGEQLEGFEPAAVHVHQREIREGPADIDAESIQAIADPARRRPLTHSAALLSRALILVAGR